MKITFGARLTAVTARAGMIVMVDYQKAGLENFHDTYGVIERVETESPFPCIVSIRASYDRTLVGEKISVKGTELFVISITIINKFCPSHVFMIDTSNRNELMG